MANMTVTTGAVFIPEVWANEILDEVEKNLVLANLVSRFDADVKNGGDIIHIPTIEGLTAQDKAATVDISYEADTEGEVQLAVDKHKYAAFKLEDILKVQSRYDLMQRYTARAGYSIARAIDSSLADLHSGFSQDVAAGAALEDADVIAAIEYLDAADAPRDSRSFVIHSEALADLRALDKFTRYDATGNKGVQVTNGLIANVYGVDVYLSNNIATTAGTPNLIHNLMFHKEAMALALQQKPKVETEYSVDSLAWKVAAHTIYGVKELRDAFGVDVTINS